MDANEVIDFFDEVGGEIERATTDGALSDKGEEAFDLVKPGGIGGREVNVPARTACRPCRPSSDLGMLVGGLGIDDEMDVEPNLHVGLDVTQKGEELMMAMARLALGDDRAVKYVEGEEPKPTNLQDGTLASLGRHPRRGPMDGMVSRRLSRDSLPP